MHMKTFFPGLMRSFWAGSFAFWLCIGNVGACRGPGSESTISFDRIPTGIDAPIIATIKDIQILRGPIQFNDSRSPVPFAGWYVAIAQVEHAWKGSGIANTIRILAPGGDCDIRLRSGDHGIVAGTLEPIGTSGDALVLVSESRAERRARESRSK
jgi:hypothetical protein